MLSFLRNRESGRSSPASSVPWFKTKSIIQDLRQKVKQFSTFCEANAGSKEVSFIATDSSEDDVTDKGAVIIQYDFGMSAGDFDPPGRPGKPTAISVEHDSIKLQWKAPQYGSSSIDSYTVSLRCINDSPDKWRNQVTKGKETAITLNQLEPDTKYEVKVRAECSLGHSEESENSDIIQTKPPMIDIRLQNIVADSKLIQSGPPVVYQIKTRPICLTRGYRNIAKMEYGTPVTPAKPTRVLLIVGATGAGKSTLINAMVNYFLGVKWEHEFRLKLIHDEVSKSQAHSQTQMITAYTFYWREGSPLNFNLTIIDTPGFGDTRGLERDQEITRHIREFFEMKGMDGVDSLHGIGFVTQASLARLTHTQKYISDSILSIFGKDIKDNILIMTTFADSAVPPVMGAVKEAKIPHSGFFRFNNSALYDGKSNFSKMFWEMGYASLEEFFTAFQQAGAVSLQMTREVLQERQQLETIVNGIQPQINAGLAKIDELNQVKQMLEAKESEITANKNFILKVKVIKQRKIDLPHGQYVTNCANCHSTCHDNCAYADDKDKWKCSAMSGDESNATCKVCVGHCTWRKHFNNGYFFEFYEDWETQTSQELYQKYNKAKSDKNKHESMIGAIQGELQKMQDGVLYNIDRTRKSLQRLDEIALRPNPLTEVDYIDLLIESEEQNKELGWQQRVKSFYAVRKKAQLVAKVIKDGDLFDKKKAQENNKSMWDTFVGVVGGFTAKK